MTFRLHTYTRIMSNNNISSNEFNNSMILNISRKSRLKHTCSQRQNSNKAMFSTNTFPHNSKRNNINNNSIRQQADIIRYIPAQNAILNDLPDIQYMQKGPYIQNIFSPDVHSTPVTNGEKSKRFSFKKNKNSSHENPVQNFYLPHAHNSDKPTNEYEMYKLQNLSNVPTISKKVEMDSNLTLYPSSACMEGKVIKRRGIRGVSWIFNLALKDDSVGKIYKKQIGVLFCIIFMLLVVGIILGCSIKYLSIDYILHHNQTKLSSKYESINFKLYKNITKPSRSTTTSTEQDISTTIYHEASTRITTLSSTIFISENQTNLEKRNEYKTDNVNSSKMDSEKNINIGYTHDEMSNMCSNCRKFLDICITVAETGIPTCKPAIDISDPTGCGGLCVLEVEACYLLNKKHSIYTCLPIETFEKCESDEWKCQNQFCIPKNKQCNGEIDCYDRSDEVQCDSCDLTKNFQCGNNTSCLDQSKKCNGVLDCWDGSDELNCFTVCPENQFTCNNGECILDTFFCDNLTDCKDKSDEPAGCTGGCKQHEFKCSNGRCIPKGALCNGKDNCGDKSDERNCSNVKV